MAALGVHLQAQPATARARAGRRCPDGPLARGPDVKVALGCAPPARLELVGDANLKVHLVEALALLDPQGATLSRVDASAAALVGQQLLGSGDPLGVAYTTLPSASEALPAEVMLYCHGWAHL